MSPSGSDKNQKRTFSGNIFIFYAFDVGDDISLEKTKGSSSC